MFSNKSITLSARLNKADVPRVYEATASIYDLWGALTETKARRRCLEMAQIRDGETVLEVAVGTGLLFTEVLKQNPSGHNEGIDLTPAMLERARQKVTQSGAKNYRLNVGDAYHLEFGDNTFDVVMNNFMFDLLPEKDFSVVLAEFKRVLRPHGRLVLVNMAQSEHWHNRLWELIYLINPAWIGGCRGVALAEHIKSAGFQHIHREFISQMTFPSEIILGRKPSA